MITKFGTYICQGCGIGSRLDCAQLSTIAEREGRSGVVKQHPMLCSQEGVSLIQKDIDEGAVEGVVLAACSRRAKTEAFDFEGAVVVRSSLREGVIWARPDVDESRETTQEMAADYIRMGCAEVRQLSLPSANVKENFSEVVGIVGAGVSGMQAALEVSAAGYNVCLIEKQKKLGGMMSEVLATLPQKASDMSLQGSDVADLVASVGADERIEVLTESTIQSTSGAPGNFVLTISGGGGDVQRMVGSIIQTTGFKDYDAHQLTEFSYTENVDVITQRELEAFATQAKFSGDPIKRPSDGKVVDSVVFVQCAGQRSTKSNHLAYCSGFCCGVSMKQARYFKEQNPQITTIIIYRDLVSTGSIGENFYRSAQQAGVLFIKGDVSSVSANGEVTIEDKILAETRTMKPDLVVLATGMVPNSGLNMDVLDDEDEVETIGKDLDAGTGITVETEIPVTFILGLDYRQGPDLPQLAHGFNDSHFLCFPYESGRTGIFAAGPVRRPMDAWQAREDATGAAMKAISAIEHAKGGRAMSPRNGDLSFPTFDPTGCTKCRRCTVECPFGAIDEDASGFPTYNESRCRRCGTCMGACPVRVISFENYNILSVGQQIKEIDIPDEFEEKPRIAVFVCQNDALPALDMAAQNGIYYSEWARVIPLRCLGSMSKDWVVDALNSGYDGVVMMGCRSDENYQCHNLSGSKMAQTRLSKISATLDTLNLEKERVAVHEVSISDIKRAPELINEMAKTISEIGPSPFKF